MQTSDKPGAGTDAQIKLRLHAEGGEASSEWVALGKGGSAGGEGGRDLFEKGQCDEFVLKACLVPCSAHSYTPLGRRGSLCRCGKSA